MLSSACSPSPGLKTDRRESQMLHLQSSHLESSQTERNPHEHDPHLQRNNAQKQPNESPLAQIPENQSHQTEKQQQQQQQELQSNEVQQLPSQDPLKSLTADRKKMNSGDSQNLKTELLHRFSRTYARIFSINSVDFWRDSIFVYQICFLISILFRDNTMPISNSQKQSLSTFQCILQIAITCFYLTIHIIDSNSRAFAQSRTGFTLRLLARICISYSTFLEILSRFIKQSIITCSLHIENNIDCAMCSCSIQNEDSPNSSTSPKYWDTSPFISLLIFHAIVALIFSSPSSNRILFSTSRAIRWNYILLQLTQLAFFTFFLVRRYQEIAASSSNSNKTNGSAAASSTSEQFAVDVTRYVIVVIQFSVLSNILYYNQSQNLAILKRLSLTNDLSQIKCNKLEYFLLNLPNQNILLVKQQSIINSSPTSYTHLQSENSSLNQPNNNNNNNNRSKNKPKNRPIAALNLPKQPIVTSSAALQPITTNPNVPLQCNTKLFSLNHSSFNNSHTSFSKQLIDYETKLAYRYRERDIDICQSLKSNDNQELQFDQSPLSTRRQQQLLQPQPENEVQQQVMSSAVEESDCVVLEQNKPITEAFSDLKSYIIGENQLRFDEFLLMKAFHDKWNQPAIHRDCVEKRDSQESKTVNFMSFLDWSVSTSTSTTLRHSSSSLPNNKSTNNTNDIDDDDLDLDCDSRYFVIQVVNNDRLLARILRKHNYLHSFLELLRQQLQGLADAVDSLGQAGPVAAFNEIEDSNIFMGKNRPTINNNNNNFLINNLKDSYSISNSNINPTTNSISQYKMQEIMKLGHLCEDIAQILFQDTQLFQELTFPNESFTMHLPETALSGSNFNPNKYANASYGAAGVHSNQQYSLKSLIDTVQGFFHLFSNLMYPSAAAATGPTKPTLEFSISPSVFAPTASTSESQQLPNQKSQELLFSMNLQYQQQQQQLQQPISVIPQEMYYTILSAIINVIETFALFSHSMKISYKLAHKILQIDVNPKVESSDDFFGRGNIFDCQEKSFENLMQKLQSKRQQQSQQTQERSTGLRSLPVANVNSQNQFQHSLESSTKNKFTLRNQQQQQRTTNYWNSGGGTAAAVSSQASTASTNRQAGSAGFTFHKEKEPAGPNSKSILTYYFDFSDDKRVLQNLIKEKKNMLVASSVAPHLKNNKISNLINNSNNVYQRHLLQQKNSNVNSISSNVNINVNGNLGNKQMQVSQLNINNLSLMSSVESQSKQTYNMPSFHMPKINSETELFHSTISQQPPQPLNAESRHPTFGIYKNSINIQNNNNNTNNVSYIQSHLITNQNSNNNSHNNITEHINQNASIQQDQRFEHNQNKELSFQVSLNSNPLFRSLAIDVD